MGYDTARLVDGFRPIGFRIFAAALLALVVLDGVAQSIDAETSGNPLDDTAALDDTFITLNGTVSAVEPDSFVLDSGGGEVVVTLAEGGPDLGERGLHEGDAVSVFGIVDDGLFGSKTIEAAGVYVDRLDRTFYASVVGDDDARQRSFLELTRSRNPFQIVVQGTVTDVSENQDGLTIAMGDETLDVRVEPEALVQTDDVTSREIAVGDRVSVTGRVEESFFDERRIAATVVQVTGN